MGTIFRRGECCVYSASFGRSRRLHYQWFVLGYRYSQCNKRLPPAGLVLISKRCADRRGRSEWIRVSKLSTDVQFD